MSRLLIQGSKRGRSQSVILLATTCVAIFFPSCAHASDIEKQLGAEYDNKVLTLRQFYDGPKLRFDSSGRTLDEATTGSWTVDAQISVKEVHLHDRLVQLKGKRVWLVFDPATSQMKDATGIILSDPLSREFRQFGSKKWQEFEKSADVEVDLTLASTPKDENEIVSAMNAVFLTASDDLANFVPEPWKWFVLKQEGKYPTSSFQDGVLKVGHGVSAPRAVSAPNPEYSEVARQAVFGRTTVLWLIVTPDGQARDVTITKPQGLGLDDKAVEAVNRWKFEPALKDGSPVAVQINVEVTFRLY